MDARVVSLAFTISLFVANDKQEDPAAGYFGNGMASVWDGNENLGPYRDTAARPQILESDVHRSRNFCGSYHDVSIDVVGDLAHNNGAQIKAHPFAASGALDSALVDKAAFNNFP